MAKKQILSISQIAGWSYAKGSAIVSWIMNILRILPANSSDLKFVGRLK